MNMNELQSELRERYRLGSLLPIAGDASTRQYWRSDGQIVMVDRAQGAQARLSAFVDRAQRLQKIGIIVPEIFIDDRENGILVLQDLGTLALRDAMNSEREREIVDLIGRVQTADHEGLNHYNQAIYAEELSRLGKYYLAPLGVDGHELAILSHHLNEEMAAKAAVFVHVDFHAENILVTPNGLGLIDFQDARFGHPLYDLVSFIDDVRRDVSPKSRDRILGRYFRGRETTTDLRDLDWLSAQRLLKIIGIFARLTAEGRSGYIEYMPRTFALVGERLAHPELRLIREWFYDVVPAWDAKNFKEAIGAEDQ